MERDGAISVLERRRKENGGETRRGQTEVTSADSSPTGAWSRALLEVRALFRRTIFPQMNVPERYFDMNDITKYDQIRPNMIEYDQIRPNTNIYY